MFYLRRIAADLFVRSTCRGPRLAIGLLLLLPVLGADAEQEGPTSRAIIGGEVATLERYPFIVAVENRDGQICTGSVIGPRWVLTSARCFLISDNPILSSPRILIGENRPLQVKSVILHDGYSPRLRYYYDIALIEVSSPMPESKIHSLGIAYPSFEQKYAPSGTSAKMLGYGPAERPTYSPIYDRWSPTTAENRQLRMASVQFYRAEDCRKRGFTDLRWEFAPDPVVIGRLKPVVIGTRKITFSDAYFTRSILCGGSQERWAFTGYGDLGGPDSGGPLVVAVSGLADARIRWLQIGLAKGMLKSRYSGRVVGNLFTRISTFSEWIKKTTRGEVVPMSVTASIAENSFSGRIGSVEAKLQELHDAVGSLEKKKTQLRDLLATE